MKAYSSKILLFIGLTLCLNSLHAESKYYIVHLDDLEYEADEPQEFAITVSRIARDTMQVINYPEITLDTKDSAAYISAPTPDPVENNYNRWWRSDNQRQLSVGFMLNDDSPVTGKVSLVRADRAQRVAYRFTFDPNMSEATTQDAFESLRAEHFARLAHSTIPGGDWFRYRAGDAYNAEGQLNRWRNLGEFDSSFNMFTGQRAVSENLALDRELILGTNDKGKEVDVQTIKGVTVAAIDWSERIEDRPTAIDPLAMVIPHEQHAAFFGSIKELNQTIRVMENEGVSYFQTISNRKTYSGLAKKYQKQMGLLIPDILAEQLPVKSLAITGGDPFFPSGTDLCVIFETDSPEALLASINMMVKAQAEASGAEVSSESSSGPKPVYSYQTKDRNFSSYVFSGDNFVAVSNRAGQVEQIRSTIEGKTPALGSLEEFKFFRQRYPLEGEATGFVFISDATIRRWAGPEFRIGASRRVRAAAALGQATAQLVDGAEIEPAYAELVGDISIENGTLRSEKFNTLEFLTPIGELAIDTVTSAEKAGYERWRNGYENGWVRFDPIALSLDIKDDSLGLDLSVIPLRLRSEYDSWIETAGDATLDRQAVTPHPEALIMVSHAIDTTSDNFRMINTQGSAMLPGIGANPFAWVGGSLSFFADQDPFWKEMNQAEDPDDYIEANLPRLPVGLRVSNKSPMKLALFLTTLRSFTEQAAPGLLAWETKEHEETPYVVIRPTERANLPDNFEIKIHYAAMPDAFILSLSEELLKRAIARSLAHSQQENGVREVEKTYHQVFAKSNLAALKTYLDLVENQSSKQQQFASWAALPILNEWKSKFPDRDPVQVHETYFKETIACPGGQGYQWNEALRSMESVAFGHPEAPREGFVEIPLFKNWKEASAAIGLKDKEFRLEAKLTK